MVGKIGLLAHCATCNVLHCARGWLSFVLPLLKSKSYHATKLACVSLEYFNVRYMCVIIDTNRFYFMYIVWTRPNICNINSIVHCSFNSVIWLTFFALFAIFYKPLSFPDSVFCSYLVQTNLYFSDVHSCLYTDD